MNLEFLERLISLLEARLSNIRLPDPIAAW